MRIALLGDIALFGKMSIDVNPEIAEYFSDVSEYLKEFDYVVGNLETPFSIEKKTKGAKSAYICTDVDNIQTLNQLHVNAVCLSNNHMFDFGSEGYETTKNILSKNGIEFFGAEGKDLKIEKDSCKIAFSGYCCYSSNPLKCVSKGEYGVNAYNVGQVSKDIKEYVSQGYLNIVAVHAGLEHVNYPSMDHIRAARKLAEVAPYVYYGHHPHVIQGIEEYKNSLIAHSLGNFCFDDVYSDTSKEPLIKLSDNNRTGIILELEVEGNKVINWREQIIYIAIEGKMTLIDNPVQLHNYNDSLAHCERDVNAYTNRRNMIIKERLRERLSNRNFSWYLKRLRPRYVRILLNARENNKLYNNNVLKYIQK